jgi:hypothetical protein
LTAEGAIEVGCLVDEQRREDVGSGAADMVAIDHDHAVVPAGAG